MKAVLQRVSQARVCVEQREAAGIGQGLLILLGVSVEDSVWDAEYLAKKCAALRVFADADGKLNRSVLDMGGEALVVSNFTLYGDCKKGNRPSFVSSAKPQVAQTLYLHFAETLRRQGIAGVYTGVFGADMQVSLTNDGPVTLVIDTAECRPDKR